MNTNNPFDKKPANWVFEKFYPEQSLRLRMSDKGCVHISTVTPSGKPTRGFYIQHEEAIALMNVSGDIANDLVSEEAQAILANKETVKEVAKLEREKVKQAQKIANQLVAEEQRLELLKAKAQSQLKTLGFDLVPTKKQA